MLDVDEAITKIDTCQLLFPSALLDRIAGRLADHISCGHDHPLSLRTSPLGTANQASYEEQRESVLIAAWSMHLSIGKLDEAGYNLGDGQ